ncbi:MAG: MBG domain-containing protein, partial [Chitinophagaceae bacterium]
GAPALATEATQFSPVSSYDIIAAVGDLASNNYSFEFAKGTLIINKKTLKVRANNQSKIYGDENPAFTVTYNGFVSNAGQELNDLSGAVTYTTLAGRYSDVGTYAIEPSAGSLNSGNYAFEFEQGTLAITKKGITITAADKSKVYGEKNPFFSVTYNGFVKQGAAELNDLSGEPAYTTTADEFSGVGSYPIEPSTGSLNSKNYSFSFINGSLAISKKMLTVKAVNQSKIYGEINPVLTAAFEGFANQESLATSKITGAPALATEATQFSPVSSYDITAAIGDLASNNYSFEFAKGTLTVNRKSLKVRANDQLKIYGEENPAFTVTYNGFVSNAGQELNDLSGAASYSTLAGRFSDVGTYDIHPAAGSLSSGNYAFEFEKGTLTISKKGITITAADKSKVYGEKNPEFNVTYNGFVKQGATELNDLSGEPGYTTPANELSAVGNYPIEPNTGTLSSKNYAFSFIKGNLAVGKKLLTVSAVDVIRLYGQENPIFTASYNGFANNENFASAGIWGGPSFTANANMLSPVGNYTITTSAGTLASGNYDFAFVNGKLTINK